MPDRLTDFSHPVTGSYHFAPSPNTLNDLGGLSSASTSIDGQRIGSGGMCSDIDEHLSDLGQLAPESLVELVEEPRQLVT